MVEYFFKENVSKTGPEYLQSPAKRRFDVIGALAIGGFGLPAVISGAGLSVFAGHSPKILFKQERQGQYGQPFNILKFTSLIAAKSGVHTEYGTFDPRSNWAGKLLRSSSVDELPQIFNVLKGDMSLVGFRPLLSNTIERFEAADSAIFDDWYERYKLGRPGLVGPASVYRKTQAHNDAATYRQSMRLEIDYADNASQTRDLQVLASVPTALLSSLTLAVGKQHGENPS